METCRYGSKCYEYLWKLGWFSFECYRQVWKPAAMASGSAAAVETLLLWPPVIRVAASMIDSAPWWLPVLVGEALPS